jgi:hypothetical protein
MALKIKQKLKARPKRDDLVVDVTDFVDLEEGQESASLRFREPGVAELMPAATKIQNLRKDFPRLSPETLRLCFMLAGCHVGEDAEDRAAARDFAEWATENPEFFLYIAGEFGTAFPMDIEQEIEDTKNV